MSSYKSTELEQISPWKYLRLENTTIQTQPYFWFKHYNSKYFQGEIWWMFQLTTCITTDM